MWILKTKYGLTLEDYERLVSSQNGLCAICKQPPTTGKGKSFHVDHCHKTGKIRGLLCNGCNIGLGQFKENSDSLLAAAKYLKDTLGVVSSE